MKRNVIIFVHGLFGNENTWMDKNANFVDLLFAHKEISDTCDYILFEYYTTISNFKHKILWPFRFLTNASKYKKNIGIHRISKLLITQMTILSDEYENIFIIAHSMGGLITRKMIVDSINEKYYDKIKFYFSLAVPNNGAELANFGNHIVRKHKQIQQLRTNDEFLSELNDKWKTHAAKLPVTIYFAGEYDEIVKPASAKGIEFRQNFEVYSTNNNHFDITKPKDLNSEQLVIISRNIINFITQLKKKEKVNELLTKYRDIPLFKELFAENGNIYESKKARFGHTTQFMSLFMKLKEDNLFEDEVNFKLNEVGKMLVCTI